MDAGDLRKWIEWLRAQESEAKAELDAAERRYEAAHKAREGAEELLEVVDPPIVLSQDDGPGDGAVVAVPRPWEGRAVRPKVRAKRSRHDSVPRGSDALERVFKDSPGKAWTVRTLLDELVARGWAPRSNDPLAAVRSNLARTVDVMGDRIERRMTEGGRYEYTYRPPELSAGEAPEAPHVPDGNGSRPFDPWATSPGGTQEAGP